MINSTITEFVRKRRAFTYIMTSIVPIVVAIIHKEGKFLLTERIEKDVSKKTNGK